MQHPSAEEARIILESIADGVFTVDVNRVITYFNSAAELITGIDRSQAVGRYCWEIFKASICDQCCSLQHTLDSGNPVISDEIFITNSEDTRIPVSITTALLKDKNNRVLGAVETFRDLSDVRLLRRELAGKYVFGEIISKNNKMLRLVEILKSVAESDISILIEGEKGTEKEPLAKTIHDMSFRKNGPLITTNCEALPEALLETELFGYTANNKSKIIPNKIGRVSLAAGGTMFLDDLDAMTPKLQDRLVRLLRDKDFEPLGSAQTKTANIRIVAATRKNLAEKVGKGSFREDLHELIGSITLRIPPLRKRKEDIPLLISHLIEKYTSLNGKSVTGVSPEALPLLMAYNYPGNTRELECIIEYALVVCPEGQIQIDHLPENLFKKPDHHLSTPHPELPSSADSLMTVERSFIYKTLMKNAWNRKATAKEMGIHPTTLWRKMKRLNLEIPVKPRRGRKK
jgi:PAS domain S-box-containing protein